MEMVIVPDGRFENTNEYLLPVHETDCAPRAIFAAVASTMDPGSQNPYNIKLPLTFAPSEGYMTDSVDEVTGTSLRKLVKIAASLDSAKLDCDSWSSWLG
jgi:hypothetical protein